MTGSSIRSTAETHKQLETTLRQAFKGGALPLVKRVTALLGIARGEPVAAVAAGMGGSPSTASAWLRTCVLEGVAERHGQWPGGPRS